MSIFYLSLLLCISNLFEVDLISFTENIVDTVRGLAVMPDIGILSASHDG